jgi:hypothetical protein
MSARDKTTAGDTGPTRSGETAMRKAAFSALGVGALLLAAGPAAAHHSGAMFDQTKQITVTGTIKEFQYTNPHSWVLVLVPDATGKTVEWGFESEGPSSLLRQGIKRSSLKEGDKVTVLGNPMKDGRPAGSLLTVTKLDSNETLYFRGRRPAGAAPPTTGGPPA